MLYPRTRQRRRSRRRRLLSGSGKTGHLPQGGQPASKTRAEMLDEDQCDSDLAGYTEAADIENQPHITDFVPVRLISLIGFFLIGGAVIASLEALHVWAASIPRFSSVRAFDLAATGNLAMWVSAFMLGAAGLAALVVYSLRRHKDDEYHGRYRIWLWAAAMWIVMSIDAVADLHHAFEQLMIHLTGGTLAGVAAFWWILPSVLLLCFVGVRLALNVRPCHTASMLLVLAIASWVAALSLAMHWISLPENLSIVMVETGILMTGHLLLLLAMALYARYVIFDVQGVLPGREPRVTWRKARNRLETIEEFDEDDVEDEATFEVGSKRHKIDPAHSRSSRDDLQPHHSPKRTKRRRRVEWNEYEDEEYQVESNYETEDTLEEYETDETSKPPDKKRRLSKSERKRLRKLKMRQRARARGN